MRVTKGFTVVEVLLAMGLFTIIVGGVIGAVVEAFSVNRLGEEESYASFLASEGLEAANAIAKRDYFNLVNGSHGITKEEGFWEFSGTADTIDSFTRRVIVSNVYRDPSGNIVSSGGVLDLFTKRVEALVTWNFVPGRSNEVSSKTYFAYWTEAICTWDSAVQVGGLDLPGSGDGQDIDVFENRAYVTTKRNGSAGEFFILSLANPTAPSILGEYEVGDHTTAVEVKGNFAYLATSRSGAELIVVNISNPATPTTAALVDIPDVTQANDISLAGDYVYLVTQSSSLGGEFYVYDISVPTSPSLKGSLEIGNHAYGVYVFQDRAYLANSHVNKEVIVVDISDPASPLELGSYDVPLAGANGQSVFYGGGVVHMTTRNNAGPIEEYYLLEASDPENIALIGALDVSAKTNGVEAGTGFSLLATEKSGEELMIIDVSNPSTPTKVFSLDLGGFAYGVALEECYAYFTSAADGQEIKVAASQ